MKQLLTLFLCAACLILTACAAANQAGLSDGLDRSVKAYNRMVRWHELEGAITTYAEPEHRKEYLKRAEVLKKQGISITDFRILSTTYIPETKSGDAVAEFDYFLLPSNRIKTISHHQTWIYHEESKNWALKNGLPPFE